MEVEVVDLKHMELETMLNDIDFAADKLEEMVEVQVAIEKVVDV